eukprot:scaffold11505_cov19-Tisochrysis_lutea.AAC.1
MFTRGNAFFCSNASTKGTEWAEGHLKVLTPKFTHLEFKFRHGLMEIHAHCPHMPLIPLQRPTIFHVPCTKIIQAAGINSRMDRV